MSKEIPANPNLVAAIWFLIIVSVIGALYSSHRVDQHNKCVVEVVSNGQTPDDADKACR